MQGDLLREEALERLKRAHALFIEGALLVVARVARWQATLTSDDVWSAMPEGLSTPEPRALGAVMRQGARDGLIQPTESWVLSTRAVCHRRPLRVWTSRIYEKRT
jgi:hypothetical protein